MSITRGRSCLSPQLTVRFGMFLRSHVPFVPKTEGTGAPPSGGACIPDLPPEQAIPHQLSSYMHHQASTLQAKTTLLALTLPIMDTPGALTPQQVACTEPVNINSANEVPISILG